MTEMRKGLMDLKGKGVLDSNNYFFREKSCSNLIVCFLNAKFPLQKNFENFLRKN